VKKSVFGLEKIAQAYPNTHQVYTIQGAQVKNTIIAQYYLELGEKDYIEIFYSVKTTNTQLVASPALSNPSRPMIPSAYLIVEKIN
jgi:flavorubredoxin